MILMPNFDYIHETSKGRSVRAGTQRAWGLQFGDLTEQIAANSLYKEGARLAAERTVMPEHSRMNLYLILQDISRHHESITVMEFGAYRGGNALFMAKVCEELFLNSEIYALDTFEGMPDADPERDIHRVGDLADADYEGLLEIISDEKLDNLNLVKGLFQDVAEDIAQSVSNLRLCHIDCDTYEAVKYSYEVTRLYMKSGGYYVFDDPLCAGCLGAMEAVEELLVRRDGLHAEQTYPHLVYRS